MDDSLLAATGAHEQTVAIDFDGVLHAYDGWKDGSIYGGWVPGAFDALRELMAQYPVAIVTSRSVSQVAAWLAQQGFRVAPAQFWESSFWTHRGIILVTNRKIAAAIYIDDRAFRFTNWAETTAVVSELLSTDSDAASSQENSVSELQ